MANLPPGYIAEAFTFHSSNKHRTMIVLVGPDTKQHIPTLHSKLTKISPLNSIFWCYKNTETAMDSVAKKQKQTELDDTVTKWLKIYTPEHILYRESHRLLGRTCDMLILQDFEVITPNILATGIETVRGGGVIILLLDQANTLSKILDTQSILHPRSSANPIFNRRLFKLLATSSNVLFLDNKMRIMSITKHCDTVKQVPEEKKKQIVERALTPSSILFSLCSTTDQEETLRECLKVIEHVTPATTVVTAPRGRGKTALLGLTAAFAIRSGYQNITVTALFPENIQTFFEHLVIGLEALGYKKMMDFKVNYVFNRKNRLIIQINMIGTNQQISYKPLNDPIITHTNLLFVDEAASIPFYQVKRMLTAQMLFLSTTVSGYEGTGRSFKTKFLEHLQTANSAERKYKKFELKEPIRYAKNDPTEEWLNRALLLDPTIFPVGERPVPSSADFFHLNKHLLFSGSNSTEDVLVELFGIFAASHYRNSPNDLQILADSENHEVFVLLNPTGRILATIQIAFEGPIDLYSTKREGNLIPWVIHEHFDSETFTGFKGLRIIRVAVHPHLYSMGYGTELLKRVESLLSLDTVSEREEDVLFSPASSLSFPKVNWIGSSFGITDKLYRFWKRSGYEAVCIKQKLSNTTGEFSGIVLKAVGNLDFGFSDAFKQRFIVLLSYSFKDLSPALCLSLLHPLAPRGNSLQFVNFSPENLSRLSLFSKGLNSAYTVLDLLSPISSAFFLSADLSKLSVLQQTLLILVGCQRKSPEEAGRILQIEEYQVENILRKTVEVLFEKS